jgi:hypothetical protein
LPAPLTIVVFSLSIITFLALPSISMVTFSSLMPRSSEIDNGGMTSRLKRPRDLSQLAKLMIDIASGEVKDHESPQKKTTKRKLPSRRSSRTQAT